MAVVPDEIEQAFRKYDADGSGFIDAKEVTTVLREVGLEVDLATAAKVVKGYDADGSGALSLDEFRKTVEELREYQASQPTPEKPPPDGVELIFMKFDTNKSGAIETKELTKMLKEVGIQVENEQTQKIFETYDTDKSGGLQLQEFRKLVDEMRSVEVHAFAKGDEKPRVAALLKQVRHRRV